MDQGSLHIVMLPWAAFGHLTPFLELSKRLAMKGHRISFLSTPRNIERILLNVPPNLASLINLVKLPLRRIDGLPEDVEATIDLPSGDLRPYLSKAFDSLQEHLANFLEKTSPPPDWIVYDYAAYWVGCVAAGFGVPCAYLGVFNAAMHGFFGPPSALMAMDGKSSFAKPEDLSVRPNWVPFPSSVAFRRYEAHQIFRPALFADASGVSEGYRLGSSVQGCQFMAIRTCKEFEPEWLRLLEELYQKPIIPLGCFPPLVKATGVHDDDEYMNIFEWLNKQEPTSVVYVAMGSEVRLSREQVHEIAHGLEQSNLPFVWALRKPPGIADGTQMLPEGFEDLTKGRGLVCMGWVPQSRILAHASVGGFLTHCGWNSLVEGLQFGIALALLPMVFDQGLNARLLVDKEIGVEVPRNEEDGSFFGGEIAKTLRLVMVDEEGEPFRAKARELRGVFGNMELQDQYLSGFVEYLRNHRRQPTPLAVAGAQQHYTDRLICTT